MKRTTFASLFALVLALATGAAQAQSPLGGNVVGGGSATLSGGGDDMTITYSPGGAGGGTGGLSQSGRLAGFAGTDGDGLQVEYLVPAPASPGREARLLGGGDNAEVVYR